MCRKEKEILVDNMDIMTGCVVKFAFCETETYLELNDCQILG